MKYWIIKARPDREDFSEFPARGSVDRWYGRRLPGDWAKGDVMFIWAGAPLLRIKGLAELTKPTDGRDKAGRRFRVRNLTDPIDGPGIEDLRKQRVIGDASFLRVGPQGTVHRLTELQGTTLLALLDPLLSDQIRDRLAPQGLPDSVLGDEPLDAEGRKRMAKIKMTERSPANRRAVLARHKNPYHCEACNMDFASTYGADFGYVIQVHHKTAVAVGLQTPKPSQFLLLCPNCHVVAHYGQRLKPRSLNQLRKLITSNRQASSVRVGL